MLKNYLKVAFRNMKRHKNVSFINITGLAIGITCCILILLWVQDELSFDQFHKNADNIYRINKKYQIGTETGY
ncbi:MAG: ABC transporter permease, partial [Candidatus Aminicenantes bacterium]|nr:ABC transporter permease [Candidatus Aminicenantes bacterium]